MFPESVDTPIQTPRLTLRLAGPGDGKAVYATVVESLDSLRTWPTSLPWALYEPSISASEDFCVGSMRERDKGTGLVFLVWDHEQQLVGSVGLHTIRWDIPSMEIGFWVRSCAHGQGFAKEAVTAVLHFAFTHLKARRVFARTDEDNVGSRATCASAGMRLEGVMKNERITPSGQLKNGCVYASTR
ncbi:RimJ/RimL family protein N-acetyltransferase [Comamonas sp. BIGb0152]|uniref:GNAT family N-acetyltransferase n=1 Tax=Comamonas sp. BIGb0152 TaxID=2940601 RepID=UPI0021683C5D|nr:GNAT family N-acetyltransferase [Comamonas sp. BIGb0152]MCS4293202.1 RimJ/RimL family protein N-acetyltransferase [Comamonas sp. BIGb0152]